MLPQIFLNWWILQPNRTRDLFIVAWLLIWQNHKLPWKFWLFTDKNSNIWYNYSFYFFQILTRRSSTPVLSEKVVVFKIILNERYKEIKGDTRRNKGRQLKYTKGWINNSGKRQNIWLKSTPGRWTAKIGSKIGNHPKKLYGKSID